MFIIDKQKIEDVATLDDFDATVLWPKLEGGLVYDLVAVDESGTSNVLKIEYEGDAQVEEYGGPFGREAVFEDFTIPTYGLLNSNGNNGGRVRSRT